jgi:hypothetical protein
VYVVMESEAEEGEDLIAKGWARAQMPSLLVPRHRCTWTTIEENDASHWLMQEDESIQVIDKKRRPAHNYRACNLTLQHCRNRNVLS